MEVTLTQTLLVTLWAFIIGIDQFLDMARTGTNVIGNSIATAVVAKSEPVEDEEDDATVARSDQPLPAGQPASIA